MCLFVPIICLILSLLLQFVCLTKEFDIMCKVSGTRSHQYTTTTVLCFYTALQTLQDWLVMVLQVLAVLQKSSGLINQ